MANITIDQKPFNSVSKILGYLEMLPVKGRCIAVLTGDQNKIAEFSGLADTFGYSLLCLDPEDELRIQKRRLNEFKCTYIFYTNDCTETIEDLYNDGSTLIQDSYSIDD